LYFPDEPGNVSDGIFDPAIMGRCPTTAG
jgi:hypothetical protein